MTCWRNQKESYTSRDNICVLKTISMVKKMTNGAKDNSVVMKTILQGQFSKDKQEKRSHQLSEESKEKKKYRQVGKRFVFSIIENNYWEKV